MRGQTNEQHAKFRDEIKEAICHLRKTGVVSEDVIDFIENTSLRVAGGVRDGDNTTPIATIVQEDSLGGEDEYHEAYGQVSFSRVNGGMTNFYGSDIRQGNFISLTIRRSRRHRSLSCDRYHGGEEIIKVYMTPAQFSELLTSMNIGSGVPCTIINLLNESMSECPEISQRELNKKEFEQKCAKIFEKTDKLVKETCELFNNKKNINKKEREEIIGRLEYILREIKANIPFMQEQYTEAMEKTETEAKKVVEAFTQHAIHSLGLKALQGNLLEVSQWDDVKQIEEEN